MSRHQTHKHRSQRAPKVSLAPILWGRRAADRTNLAPRTALAGVLLPDTTGEFAAGDYEWAAAFDQLEDSVFIHDADFRILRCNAAYAALAELPISEIIGKHYWEVWPRRDAALPGCLDAAKGSRTVMRTEVTTAAGQVFLTHDITAHRASGDFWYSRHLMENITARKLLEEAEHLRTSFSDAILGSAPGVFVVLDRQGKFVRWNAEVKELTALSDAELAKASISQLVDPDEHDRLSGLLESAISGGAAQGEIRLLAQGRKPRDFVFSARRFEVANTTYLVGFGVDMAEVKKLESDLQREKAMSDTIIESAPGAFFMIDQNSNLVRWNKNLSGETGLSDEQLRGTSLLSTVYEPDRPLAAAKILLAFAVGHAQMEVRVQTPIGLRYFLKSARRLLVDGVPYLAGFCLDITDRKKTEHDLVKEKAFSDALVESVPGAFYVVDHEGNYFRWNSYLKQITGLSDNQLHDQPSLLTIQPEDRPLAAATMKEAFERGYAQVELHLVTNDGNLRLYLMTARRFEVEGETYLVGVGVDTTEWIEKLTALQTEAWTDALTQIPNRGHFLDLARQEFGRCRRYSHPLSVWMIDVDHFKAVNDTYGHQVGDLALQTLVKASRLVLRDWDIMGRMGGEEFAVLLPETTPEKSLLVAERLRQAVTAAVVTPGGDIRVRMTVSIGIADAGEQDEGIEALLNRADQALYEAKQTGRDKVCPNARLNKA